MIEKTGGDHFGGGNSEVEILADLEAHGGDADHRAVAQDHRPAAVAGADRRGNLNVAHPVDFTQPTDDARRKRAFQTVGITDHEDIPAHQILTVGFVEHKAVRAVKGRGQQRQIGRFTPPAHLGYRFPTVALYRQVIGFFDHMVVGQHQSVGVDHNA